MTVSLRTTKNKVIMDIHCSRLDGGIVPVMRKTVSDLIEKGFTNILLNFSQINSLSSEALGFLIAAQKKCVRKRGEISLFGMRNDILAIFYVIQLDEYLKLYSCEADALNRVNPLVKRRFKVVRY